MAGLLCVMVFRTKGRVPCRLGKRFKAFRALRSLPEPRAPLTLLRSCPCGKRVQHIHIKYDGLDFIPPDKLIKEDAA